jgi:hypothetical protein
MFLQVCAPPHVIVHALLPTQLIPLVHALAVEHAMLQLQPVGQVIGWLHAPLLIPQSIAQLLVSALHEVHCEGQAAGASTATLASTGVTQKWSMQVRPAAQSACLSHTKSSLWWLTEQPLQAAITANPRTERQRAITIAITIRACLRA